MLRYVFVASMFLTFYLIGVFAASELYMQRLINKVLDEEELLEQLEKEEEEALAVGLGGFGSRSASNYNMRSIPPNSGVVSGPSGIFKGTIASREGGVVTASATTGIGGGVKLMKMDSCASDDFGVDVQDFPVDDIAPSPVKLVASSTSEAEGASGKKGAAAASSSSNVPFASTAPAAPVSAALSGKFPTQTLPGKTLPAKKSATFASFRSDTSTGSADSGNGSTFGGVGAAGGVSESLRYDLMSEDGRSPLEMRLNGVDSDKIAANSGPTVEVAGKYVFKKCFFFACYLTLIFVANNLFVMIVFCNGSQAPFYACWCSSRRSSHTPLTA
jgi:hypothetical protein